MTSGRSARRVKSLSVTVVQPTNVSEAEVARRIRAIVDIALGARRSTAVGSTAEIGASDIDPSGRSEPI